MVHRRTIETVSFVGRQRPPRLGGQGRSRSDCPVRGCRAKGRSLRSCSWRDRLRRPLTSSHSHRSGTCGKDGANGRPIGSTCAAAPLTSSAALTRNQIRFPGTHTEVPVLTEPTPAQREAFTLIGPRIPLTL